MQNAQKNYTSIIEFISNHQHRKGLTKIGQSYTIINKEIIK